MKSHRYRRFAFWAILVLLVAWLLPSLLSAERFRRRLETRLEQALGRSVHFGSISPKLLPLPGFSLDNVTISEDPAFGSEPFARVDHADCDLALWGLLRGRIELGRLRLEGATINVVRSPPDRWNVDRLVSAAAPAAAGRNLPTLSIEVQDARLNFEEDTVKKPFTVTGLDGRVIIDRAAGAFSFDVSGTPVRTDLGLPSPGRLALVGAWRPLAGGTVDATLRTRGALLYDWIPLVTGRNPDIYGVLDVDMRVGGSLRLLTLDGHLRLSRTRRWESLPPAGDLPIDISAKAALDRDGGKLRLSQVVAGFGKSRVQLGGTVAEPGAQAMLDLTASVSGAHVEDFSALVARLTSRPASWAALGATGITGLADGQVSIQGPWMEPAYFGSFTTRAAHLIVRGVSLPLSGTVIQAQGRHIELAPTHIEATPALDIIAQGSLRLVERGASEIAPRRRARLSRMGRPPAASPASGYQLALAIRAATARDVVAFARNLNLRAARDLDARGAMSATLDVTGNGWPPAPPALSGTAELRGAQIGLPGLSRPLRIREARLQLDGDRVVVSPASFAIGASTFTGRVEHTGPRSRPWSFDLRGGDLDLGQATSWFEALGHRPVYDWLATIPGVGNLAARRAAGTSIFNALNARGEFSSPLLSYRGVNLRGFHAGVEIGQRVIHVSSASFRISSGRGQAEATADLNGLLPRLSAEFSIAGLRLENWASHLPPQLAGVRGSARLEGRLSAEGTSRAGLQSTLEGRGTLGLVNVDLGRFDPLRDAAHAADWGDLAPSRVPLILRSASLDLEVKNQRLVVKPARFQFAGAAFELSGSCAFDQSAQFESIADLRHVDRRWLASGDAANAHEDEADQSRVTRFLLSGPLDALNATREERVSEATPARP
ncbi:MAG TPA: AsmA family protein [Terriglobia bacterium]|nr:AsmA family protein [Terriglobia bacterium]